MGRYSERADVAHLPARLRVERRRLDDETDEPRLGGDGLVEDL